MVLYPNVQESLMEGKEFNNIQIAAKSKFDIWLRRAKGSPTPSYQGQMFYVIVGRALLFQG